MLLYLVIVLQIIITLNINVCRQIFMYASPASVRSLLGSFFRYSRVDIFVDYVSPTQRIFSSGLYNLI